MAVSKQLSVFGGTWNVNGKKPAVDVSEWLFGPGSGAGPPHKEQDIYLIGMQEVQALAGMNAVSTDMVRGRAWKEAIEASINKSSQQNQYTCILFRQMVGIMLVVFVRSDLANQIKNLRMSEVGTGFLNVAGNKGGVACRFDIFGLSVAAVACHLAAHEANVERRNQDFAEVLRKTFVEANNTTGGVMSDFGDSGTGVLLQHDVIFWLGDLNYRINLDVPQVLQLIEQKNWEELRKYDQLNQVRRQGNPNIQGFEEAQITFAPTYKLSVSDPSYQMDEEGGVKRTPSWTDRILWRIKPGSNGAFGFRVCAYRRHEVYSSDHRPVSAVFELTIPESMASRANKRTLTLNGASPNVVLNHYERERITTESIVINREVQIREEAMIKPQIELEPTTLSFGILRLAEQSWLSVVVTNTGNVNAVVEIHPGNSGSWLRIPSDSEIDSEEAMRGSRIRSGRSNSSNGGDFEYERYNRNENSASNSNILNLRPKEKAEAVFVACFDPLASKETAELVENLLTRKEKDLESIVRFRVRNGGEQFLVVSASLIPTALGMSLNLLARLPVSMSEFASSQSMRLSESLPIISPIPPEVFVLVDSVWQMIRYYQQSKRSNLLGFIATLFGARTRLHDPSTRKKFDSQVDSVMKHVINQRKPLDPRSADVFGDDPSRVDPFAVWCAFLTFLRFCRNGVLPSGLVKDGLDCIMACGSIHSLTSLFNSVQGDLYLKGTSSKNAVANPKIDWLRNQARDIITKAQSAQYNTMVYISAFMNRVFELAVLSNSQGRAVSAVDDPMIQDALLALASALFHSHLMPSLHPKEADQYKVLLLKAILLESSNFPILFDDPS